MAGSPDTTCPLGGNTASTYEEEPGSEAPPAGRLEGRIPVVTGVQREGPPPQERGPPARKVVRRDEGLVQALTLPAITVYNMRSMWPKIGNMAEDITMRNTDLCFLTEVWEKKESKRHQHSIEEIMEMKDIKYISTPRPGGRRGGGVGIAYSEKHFQVSKLNIEVKKPLECLFGLSNPEVTLPKLENL
jgi:hypothetical protein